MSRIRLVLIRSAAVLAVWSALFGGAAPPVTAGGGGGSASAPLRFRLPYLDGGIEDPNAPNLARSGPRGAPLLLFLAATRSVPSQYSAFLDTASRAGYSVLGLDYFNRGRSLTRTCGPRPDCYGSFERNRLDGTSASRFSRVDAENSILTRLTAALAYLEKADPGGDWGRFRAGSGIAWSRVVVAGHSQGGGEAAFISHRFAVRGVLMFASPVQTFGRVSAEWMASRGRTPPSRMYALASPGDMYFTRIAPSWTKLGMGTGDPARAVPFPTGGHTLLTSLDLGAPRQAHGRIVGGATPRNRDGTPLLAPTWRWMLAQVR